MCGCMNLIPSAQMPRLAEMWLQGKRKKKLDQDALNIWQQDYWYSPNISIDKAATKKSMTAAANR